MRRWVTLASSGLLAAGLLGLAPTGGASTGATAPPALRISMPGHLTWYEYDGDVYVDQGADVIAGNTRFELRAERPGYQQPIVVRWWHGGGWQRLPRATMTSFGGLPAFFQYELRDSAGHVVKSFHQRACLNGTGTRVRPDAPARSPYPDGCPTNPYTVGSVMGVQAGWVTAMYNDSPTLHLAAGTYTMTASITPKYRKLFHLPLRTSHATSTVRILEGDDGEGGGDGGDGGGVVPTPIAPDPAARLDARPVAERSGVTNGPRPDLRSLPAWGIDVSPDGNHLNFSATVWNAGSSPMVVDGFRRKHQALMDAYQYFFDKRGHQTGYRKIGHMEWDPRPSHHHWHFEDFARYRLVSANGKLVRRSHKEAFCLANTDAVDYTIPFAAWHPENTDLSTACGDFDSPAVREELSVGSGDTYSQERAGQSFTLSGLPNGVYYVEVKANPAHRLVETNTGNNVSRRKVRISGTAGHRTVKVWKVGRVVEPPIDDAGEGVG